ASASGLSSMIEFKVGPEKSIRSTRRMYARVSRRDVVSPDAIAAWSSAIVASFHLKESFAASVAAAAGGAPAMPSVEAADAAAPAAAEYLRKLRRSMPSGEPSSRRSSIALPFLRVLRQAERGRGETP